MGVQVHVQADFAIFNLLLDGFFNGPNRRLALLARVDVVTIQILREGVQSIVASVDAIGVQHWDHFEDEFVTEDLCLLAVLVGQEFPNAVKDEGSRCFSRVHP